MPSLPSRDRTPGRPVVTSHGEIEQTAFRLFAERGFDGTTMEAIATEVGVGRRTLFRYFASKNDIPWGRFADTLEDFERVLVRTAPNVPLWEAVHRGVLAFNTFPAGTPRHRDRMQLILGTPALQAHSALRYAEWRAVIERYVAARTGGRPSDPLPVTVGHVSLGLALSAYDVWLADGSAPDEALVPVLDEAMTGLRRWLAA